MRYIYNNCLYDNIFELIDTNFHGNSITTVGSMKEDDRHLYSSKILSIIENLADNLFFDTKINKSYTIKEFYKLYNIKEATAKDLKLINCF